MLLQNGYIVDILGPFYANQNDAEIMKITIQDSSGLQTLLKRGDICIVDRDFRDVKSYLEESGYKVLMPALKGKRSQLTTVESNASRQVTKVRWVVEAIHGSIGQKCRLLLTCSRNNLFTSLMLDYLATIVRPAVNIDQHIFNEEHITPVINEDSDED
ncbi:hypothetical protein ANTRET_LOCUS6956 [Anthophora retusa]